MKQILLLILISITIFLAGCTQDQVNTERVDPMYFCNSKSDCTILNFDCSSCSCDLKAVNIDYKNKICENFTGEPCDMVCQVVDYKCSNNQCVVQ